MPITDWMQEAANEIADAVRYEDGNEDDFRKIILQHCPFKGMTLDALRAAFRKSDQLEADRDANYRNGVLDDHCDDAVSEILVEARKLLVDAK